MRPRLTIGSDTQNFETVEVVSGIQRVVRDAHIGLVDRLTPRGVDVVPFHPSPRPRRPAFLGHDYLADDPVLYLTPRQPDDLDAFMLLDVSLNADLSRVVASLRSRNRPAIALVHDVIPLKDTRAFDDRDRMTFRLYLQQVLHVANHIVVTSEQTRQDLLGLGWNLRGDIHIIPLGSAFGQRCSPSPPDDRLSLLYVSTLEPRKGHHVLLDAFDILLSDGIDVDLTLIGRPGWSVPDVFSTDALIKRIRGHLEFGGRLRWVCDADDLTLITTARSCVIGVFPSRVEGFGLFLEEGLALGLKMVVSDIPVFRERDQPNVMYCELEGQAFADGILTAHQRPWHTSPEPVRTMDDFVDDLAALVMEVVGLNAQG